MKRLVRTGIVLALGTVLALSPHAANAQPPVFTPGAPGIGDPYFPLDGNGGYDVAHYDLDVKYTPAYDALVGVATIHARATQYLSRFDLDLVGLTVRSITIDGRPATFTRSGQELVVTPPKGLAKGHKFTTVVKYDGVPVTFDDPLLGTGGFFHTTDGEVVAGQPQSASSWFPVNDHPADKASYTFNVTVPTGLDVLANGKLIGKKQQGPVTRWTWAAKEPMASYLATIDTGHFDVTSYRYKGKSYVDGIEKSLFVPFATPRTGSQYAFSGAPADNSYKRLTHTITVPAGGATLSFQEARDIEDGWDYTFVEVHPVGSDAWTTLPDENGHTSTDTGNACLESGVHPFLAHYQTEGDDGSCTPTGTTGEWNAATGASDGYEPWKVDLSAYAGQQVEVSISYASDYAVQGEGVAIDDVVSSIGQGTTGFEADSDPLDGWQVAGPPADSPGNTSDWAAGDASDITTTGDVAKASLAREPEIIDFLSKNFGRYPFSAVGGIVPADDRLGFALETQTRPVYSRAFFSDIDRGSGVVVHELTHQWYGDSLSVKQWKEIWLNEGFASYAEWLWSEHEDLGTAQEIFDADAAIPADDPFWQVVIGDPTPEHLFDGAVYDRGAMTLHALRLKIGDDTFFKLLKKWAYSRAGGNVTTPQFIKLAEQMSGQNLGAFFTTWLYTPEKPAGLEGASPAAKLAKGKAKVTFTPEGLARRFGDRP